MNVNDEIQYCKDASTDLSEMMLYCNDKTHYNSLSLINNFLMIIIKHVIALKELNLDEIVMGDDHYTDDLISTSEIIRTIYTALVKDYGQNRLPKAS